MKKGGHLKKILIGFGALAVIGVIGSSLGNSGDKKVADNSVKSENSSTASETGVTGVNVQKENAYGDIHDFDYEISNDTIILKSYKGKDSILEIRPSYALDGMEYKTDISDFQVGIGNRKVETLILDEGITEVKTAIFNSCKVKTVFFPHSMTNVYDYTLSYLHPDKGETISIYYAGTQEEWSDIFTEYKRTDVGDTKLGKEMGAALGDKLNEAIGSEYDSSLFEYYFSATPDVLIK